MGDTEIEFATIADVDICSSGPEKHEREKDNIMSSLVEDDEPSLDFESFYQADKEQDEGQPDSVFPGNHATEMAPEFNASFTLATRIPRGPGIVKNSEKFVRNDIAPGANIDVGTRPPGAPISVRVCSIAPVANMGKERLEGLPVLATTMVVNNRLYVGRLFPVTRAQLQRQNLLGKDAHHDIHTGIAKQHGPKIYETKGEQEQTAVVGVASMKFIGPPVENASPTAQKHGEEETDAHMHTTLGEEATESKNQNTCSETEGEFQDGGESNTEVKQEKPTPETNSTNSERMFAEVGRSLVYMKAVVEVTLSMRALKNQVQASAQQEKTTRHTLVASLPLSTATAHADAGSPFITTPSGTFLLGHPPPPPPRSIPVWLTQATPVSKVPLVPVPECLRGIPNVNTPNGVLKAMKMLRNVQKAHALNARAEIGRIKTALGLFPELSAETVSETFEYAQSQQFTAVRDADLIRSDEPIERVCSPCGSRDSLMWRKRRPGWLLPNKETPADTASTASSAVLCDVCFVEEYKTIAVVFSRQKQAVIARTEAQVKKLEEKYRQLSRFYSEAFLGKTLVPGPFGAYPTTIPKPSRIRGVKRVFENLIPHDMAKKPRLDEQEDTFIVGVATPPSTLGSDTATTRAPSAPLHGQHTPPITYEKTPLNPTAAEFHAAVKTPQTLERTHSRNGTHPLSDIAEQCRRDNISGSGDGYERERERENWKEREGGRNGRWVAPENSLRGPYPSNNGNGLPPSNSLHSARSGDGHKLDVRSEHNWERGMSQTARVDWSRRQSEPRPYMEGERWVGRDRDLERIHEREAGGDIRKKRVDSLRESLGGGRNPGQGQGRPWLLVDDAHPAACENARSRARDYDDQSARYVRERGRGREVWEENGNMDGWERTGNLRGSEGGGAREPRLYSPDSRGYIDGRSPASFQYRERNNNNSVYERPGPPREGAWRQSVERDRRNDYDGRPIPARGVYARQPWGPGESPRGSQGSQSYTTGVGMSRSSPAQNGGVHPFSRDVDIEMSDMGSWEGVNMPVNTRSFAGSELLNEEEVWNDYGEDGRVDVGGNKGNEGSEGGEYWGAGKDGEYEWEGYERGGVLGGVGGVVGGISMEVDDRFDPGFVDARWSGPGRATQPEPRVLGMVS